MASHYLFLYQSIYGDVHLPATIIAGSFGFVALTLSLFLCLQHLRWYTNPAEQKWIVAVIFMVPVYATESIFSLWNPNLSLACDILRNCYEAFALYAFGSYLVACLGGEVEVLDLLENEAMKQISKPLLEAKVPAQEKTCRNFFKRPCRLGKDLFSIIRFGLVQYMILKTLCAFLAFVLELCGVYGDGKFKWYYGYPYITIVLNFSQMWALYCLVQFYNVTHQRLEPIKPLAKFISFKAIVFATWWQGVGIILLAEFRFLPKEGEFQTGLQDFLICIEMAIAAVAHIFVFSAKLYHFLPASEFGNITTRETTAKLKIEEGDVEKQSTVIEKKETKVEAPGTSVKESVEDIVVEGGQKPSLFLLHWNNPKLHHKETVQFLFFMFSVFACVPQVVMDVVLTINQAIEPVHEGVTKIQETFHKMSVSGEGKEEEEMKVEEHEENIKYRRRQCELFKSEEA